jgi:hypothetical protein
MVPFLVRENLANEDRALMTSSVDAGLVRDRP